MTVYKDFNLCYNNLFTSHKYVRIIQFTNYTRPVMDLYNDTSQLKFLFFSFSFLKYFQLYKWPNLLENVFRLRRKCSTSLWYSRNLFFTTKPDLYFIYTLRIYYDRPWCVKKSLHHLFIVLCSVAMVANNKDLKLSF